MPNINRRQCLLGACAVGLGMALNVGANVAAEAPASRTLDKASYPRNVDEALARSKAGNQRFMEDKPAT